MAVIFRDLHTLEEFARVVELERVIWGGAYADVVPVPILVITVKRGGILIGAFDDEGEMVGFVYSLAGLKDERPMQWSHMLGVVEAHRNGGLGRLLKLEQRRRTIEMGLDLIEWTFDPLQALNAHLNLRKLGVIVDEYLENVYGESTSALHRGAPTDRFVAAWWVSTPRVEHRLSQLGPRGSGLGAGVSEVGPRASGLGAGVSEVGPRASGLGPGVSDLDATVVTGPLANTTKSAGEWLACDSIDLTLDSRRVLVEIPMGFTDMLARNPSAARDWRAATREIFTAYFARGYEAVDFLLDRGDRRGRYLLVKKSGV